MPTYGGVRYGGNLYFGSAQGLRPPENLTDLPLHLDSIDELDPIEALTMEGDASGDLLMEGWG